MHRVHHASDTTRRDRLRPLELRPEVDVEIRFVPEHPVPHAREPLITAPVTLRRCCHEVSELGDAGAASARSSTAATALRPGRGREDVDDRLKASRRGSFHRVVEPPPLIAGLARVPGVEVRWSRRADRCNVLPPEKQSDELHPCSSRALEGDVFVGAREVGRHDTGNERRAGAAGAACDGAPTASAPERTAARMSDTSEHEMIRRWLTKGAMIAAPSAGSLSPDGAHPN